MFEKTLHERTKKALAVLGESSVLKKAYLGGGSACALHLGHRISLDLDFFTAYEFDPKKFVTNLRNIGKFKLDQIKQGTILGTFEDIRFSLFLYDYRVLFDFSNFLGIKILDLRDLAAMKIAAISDRGMKRDFIDLYFICRRYSLKETLTFFDKKYGLLRSNVIHVLKSLVYFVDADEQEMPKMLKPCRWSNAKLFFEKEVRKLSSKK